MDQASLKKNIYDAILEDKPKKKKYPECYVCGRVYMPVWQGSAFCSERCATAYDNGYPSYQDIMNSPEYHLLDDVK